MKVALNESGPMAGLKWHIEQEGDDIVNGRLDTDAYVRDPMLLPGSHEIEQGQTTKWFLSCVFDGHEFLESTLVCGVPLVGLMNGNQSLSKSVGVVLGYVDAVSNKFWNTELKQRMLGLLRGMDYNGYVSWVCTLSENIPLCKATLLGVPFNGFYALAEGLNQKISDFHKAPQELKKSWVASLAVSRYPGPRDETANKISFSLPMSVQKHFWMPPTVSRFKNGLSTQSTFIGYATAWSDFKLGSVVSKVLVTCDHLPIPEKQYRTDLRSQTYGVFRELVRQGIIELDRACSLD